jgi:hypothetical protein
MISTAAIFILQLLITAILIPIGIEIVGEQSPRISHVLVGMGARWIPPGAYRYRYIRECVADVRIQLLRGNRFSAIGVATQALLRAPATALASQPREVVLSYWWGTLSGFTVRLFTVMRKLHPWLLLLLWLTLVTWLILVTNLSSLDLLVDRIIDGPPIRAVILLALIDVVTIPIVYVAARLCFSRLHQGLAEATGWPLAMVACSPSATLASSVRSLTSWLAWRLLRPAGATGWPLGTAACSPSATRSSATRFATGCTAAQSRWRTIFASAGAPGRGTLRWNTDNELGVFAVLKWALRWSSPAGLLPGRQGRKQQLATAPLPLRVARGREVVLCA